MSSALIKTVKEVRFSFGANVTCVTLGKKMSCFGEIVKDLSLQVTETVPNTPK